MDEPYDSVEEGIRQVEHVVREGDLHFAKLAFELLSGGIAGKATASQLGRMRRLATAIGANFAIGGEGPEWSAEEATASGFGMH